MEQLKQRKFTLLGLLLIVVYGLLIWPFPEHFPILSHHIFGLLVMVSFGILMSLDHRKK